MRGQYEQASAHTINMGDTMGRKKSFRINFISNGKDPNEAVRELVKEELKKVLVKNNAMSYNLDEVVNKYVSGEMCNEQKER